MLKKYLSVFKLYILGCFPACFGSMLGLFIAQALEFFYKGLGQMHLGYAFSRGIRFSDVVIAIPMLAVQLCLRFCDRGGKMNNTLQRLSISEKQGFWMQAACNAFIFALYFLFQALVFILFCFWYDPQVTGLEILVTAYEDPLFHTFFPLDDLVGMAANLVMILGLAICCAAYPMRQRHGKYSITTFLMGLAAYFYLYLQNEGSHLGYGNQVMIIFVTIYCITVSLAGTMSLEVDENG